MLRWLRRKSVVAPILESAPEPDAPLDELSLRRTDFLDGPRVRWIELANGQKFAFAKPVLEIRLEPRPDGSMAFAGKASYGDGGTRIFGQEYLELLDRLNSGESDYERLCVLGSAAAMLLRLNYGLTIGHITTLLPWVVGADGANETMWTEIREVVTGESPKHGPAGDAWDSSSPAG